MKSLNRHSLRGMSTLIAEADVFSLTIKSHLRGLETTTSAIALLHHSSTPSLAAGPSPYYICAQSWHQPLLESRYGQARGLQFSNSFLFFIGFVSRSSTYVSLRTNISLKGLKALGHIFVLIQFGHCLR